MVHRLGVEGFHEAKIVGDRGDLREKIGDPRARFSVLREFRNLTEHGACGLVACHGGEAFAAGDFVGDLLAVPFAELRFVVEKVDVGRRAVLEKIDDAFRFRGEVREIGQTGDGATNGKRERGRRGESVAAEKRSERGGADTQHAAAEKLAARVEGFSGEERVHERKRTRSVGPETASWEGDRGAEKISRVPALTSRATGVR